MVIHHHRSSTMRTRFCDFILFEIAVYCLPRKMNYAHCMARKTKTNVCFGWSRLQGWMQCDQYKNETHSPLNFVKFSNRACSECFQLCKITRRPWLMASILDPILLNFKASSVNRGLLIILRTITGIFCIRELIGFFCFLFFFFFFILRACVLPVPQHKSPGFDVGLHFGLDFRIPNPAYCALDSVATTPAFWCTSRFPDFLICSHSENSRE